jgi:hypothetical protein
MNEGKGNVSRKLLVTVENIWYGSVTDPIAHDGFQYLKTGGASITNIDFVPKSIRDVHALIGRGVPAVVMV